MQAKVCIQQIKRKILKSAATQNYKGMKLKSPCPIESTQYKKLDNEKKNRYRFFLFKNALIYIHIR